jgi:hypothetical protein
MSEPDTVTTETSVVAVGNVVETIPSPSRNFAVAVSGSLSVKTPPRPSRPVSSYRVSVTSPMSTAMVSWLEPCVTLFTSHVPTIGSGTAWRVSQSQSAVIAVESVPETDMDAIERTTST